MGLVVGWPQRPGWGNKLGRRNVENVVGEAVGRRSAPVGPLGTDLRVAPSVESGLDAFACPNIPSFRGGPTDR
jgi:hypothetical protein